MNLLIYSTSEESEDEDQTEDEVRKHEKENPVAEVHEKRDKMKQQIFNGDEAKTHDEEK
ncbi:hypothetical protein DAPPUDRAFT_253927 [Daphnia pulex]|uniref:Uncharacterized protein n=1 Tax=Daphnia pulex TaxID=6669 RepID=E9H5Y7_DAPPU|nr:hypothetical protein DAPPUDRAFT_253927 [Daphnia pulex]|eukprot:EFX72849.1 hypothetical protein DAPPUDRAFT_253927 [Daphnia pulex]